MPEEGLDLQVGKLGLSGGGGAEGGRESPQVQTWWEWGAAPGLAHPKPGALAMPYLVKGLA